MNVSRQGTFEPAEEQQSSVGIVGAGISGLIAAEFLADRGVTLRIFDKARGVGGRASVRRYDDLHFDHGAQYFTVHDDRFGRAVDGWRKAGIVAPWHGRVAAIEHGRIRPTADRQRYVGVPAMNAIARHLAHSLPVTTGTRVATVQRRDDRWNLFDHDNRHLGSFHAMIVALPAPQAADLLSTLPALAQRARDCPLAP